MQRYDNNTQQHLIRCWYQYSVLAAGIRPFW